MAFKERSMPPLPSLSLSVNVYVDFLLQNRHILGI
jgi:hypothetical protein